jgi:outer membrane immunogenic protein
MKKLMMAMAALGLMTGTAQAAGGSWTGCSLGVAGGVSIDKSVNSLTAPGIAVTVDGLGADGHVLALGAGCDYQLDRIVVGLFGDYDFGKTEFLTTAAFGPVTANISAAIRDNWTIGARAGFLATPDTLMYGLVGWTNARTDDIALTTNAGFNLALTPGKLDGMTLGGGIETRLSKSVSTKIEYRYTQFDKVDMPVFAGLNLGQENDMHTVRVGLNWRFNLFDRDVDYTPPLK